MVPPLFGRQTMAPSLTSYLIDRAGPAGEVLAVEDVLEAGLACACAGLRWPRPPGSRGRRCSASGSRRRASAAGSALLRGSGSLRVPEVLQAGVIDDELVVEVDGDALADHEDAEAVPLAERLVGQDERVLAGRAGAVVPQAAGALVGAEVPLAAFLGVVPDLHLRRGPQVDAAVGLGHGLVVDQQLDVAVSPCRWSGRRRCRR